MSDIKLKLYKEGHTDDNLLPAIWAVFTEAQIAGCKTCFVEFPLDKQASYDRKVADIAAIKFNGEATLRRMINEYDAGNNVQRQLKTADFLMVLSAMTGIRLVCADVGERRQIIEIRYRFMQLMKDRANAEAVLGDFAKAAEALNCPIDQVEKIFAQFTRELTEKTFKENLQRELAERFADDPKIAEFTVSYLAADGAPAIAFWGRGHVDIKRPDSLGSLLMERMGEAVKLFHIVDGRIIAIPTPARGDTTPSPPGDHFTA